MRRRLPILVFLCALLGCTPPPPECLGLEALGLDLGDLLEESDPEEPDFPAFALGVEYAQSGLGSTYAGTGVGWAKTRLEVFSWQTTEPSAPRDGVHDYDWRCTDAEVAEWQQAGVTRLQASLNPSSSWGSRSTTGDIRPKEDREDEYRAWVGALIERYDGDGVDDMPGLVRPVRHWVVGGEWSSFWPSDDAPGYLEVLEMTREEARAASEEVLLGSIPFLLLDVFEGNEPSPEQVSTRLEDPPSVLRNSTEGMHAILDRPELFDYIDVHSLGDYTELPPLAAWLRAEMAARDYDKPLWIDDAYSISFLANRYWPAVHPVAEEDYEAVYGVLDAVASYESEAGEEWLRAEAAKGVVHKGATALGEGFVGVQLGTRRTGCRTARSSFGAVRSPSSGLVRCWGWSTPSRAGATPRFEVPERPGLPCATWP